jgi:hypothetical protein
MMDGDDRPGSVRVQYLPVGRARHEWIWKVRDEESNTIVISGHRFESLGEAVRDARMQIGDLNEPDGSDDDGPAVA